MNVNFSEYGKNLQNIGLILIESSDELALLSNSYGENTHQKLVTYNNNIDKNLRVLKTTIPPNFILKEHSILIRRLDEMSNAFQNMIKSINYIENKFNLDGYNTGLSIINKNKSSLSNAVEQIVNKIIHRLFQASKI
ncbi:hypothetical protein [Bacillus cereus]|uniref:hypothetical protein n=1 Tax=Bacillus cereus TaxID=1396 RepID=UPI00397FB0A7